MQNIESTDETEGSSGVESSEAGNPSDDDNYSDNENVSSKQAKPSAADSREVKNGRAILNECVESFQGVSITTETLKWTQQL